MLWEHPVQLEQSVQSLDNFLKEILKYALEQLLKNFNPGQHDIPDDMNMTEWLLRKNPQELLHKLSLFGDIPQYF